PLLPLLDRQVLPHHDHAVRLPALARAVGELRHLLTLQADVLEAALPDHLLLDVRRPPPRLRGHRVARRPRETLPGAGWQILRCFTEHGEGVDAQIERPAPLAPAVKLPCLREVGVAAEDDTGEAGLPYQGDTLINPVDGIVVARPVAWPIDDEQRLLGIGQGY